MFLSAHKYAFHSQRAYIDSGAFAHMTPLKKDCTSIQPTYKMIYLTAGSSVLFKNMGNISISISKNNKIFGSLVLADVIIVKNLDRQLFSVNTFLSKGHNRVHFSQPKAPENVLHYLSLLNKQKQPERK